VVSYTERDESGCSAFVDVESMIYLFPYLMLVGATILLLAGVILSAWRQPFSPYARGVRRRIVPSALIVTALLSVFGLFLYVQGTASTALAQQAGLPPPTPDRLIVWMVLLFLIGASIYFLTQAYRFLRYRQGAVSTEIPDASSDSRV
jgi:uncharacterized integral membrane protein